MKANELRLGNYVNKITTSDNDADLTIINAIDIFNVSADIDFYEPITLTEEWLLRLGFLQCRENQAGKTYAIFIDGFRFDDSMIVICSSTGLFWRKNMVMEYVHQVQNLYFALTGEELTVNN